MILKYIFFVILYLIPIISFAQESVLQSHPIGGDATELKIPSSQILEAESSVPLRIESDIKDFIFDSTLSLQPRTMYFNRDSHLFGEDNNDERASWAAGGIIAFKSGKIEDIFDIRAELFHVEKIYGPLDKDGALVLKTNQENYTVIGVANPRFQYKGNILSLYRQKHDMPYVNSEDSRMTPNTFESYSYGFIGTEKNSPLKFGLGYIDKIKRRNEDEFITVSEAAGSTAESQSGMPWMGFKLIPHKKFSFSAVNYSLIDCLNIFYTEIDYADRLNDSIGYKATLQYSNQTEIGEKQLQRNANTTGSSGALMAISYNNILFRSAVTINSASDALISPFGAYPGYTGSIVEDFNRAGEIAWKTGLSYDFSAKMMNGLSAYLEYIHSNNALDESNSSLPDIQEVDINMDYRPTEGLLSNYWLRIRAGFVDYENGDSATDVRLIISHALPVF